MEYSNIFRKENKVELSYEPNSIKVRTNSWIHPLNQDLKFNLDGPQKDNKGAIDVIVRWDRGSIVQAWIRLGKWNSPMELEDAIFLLISKVTQFLGIRQVVFKSDCMVLINAIRQNGICPWCIHFSSWTLVSQLEITWDRV